MKNKIIKILGAGISGLTAGIVLSKHGYKVEIFEKRSHVGSFFEKDIHSFRNYLYSYDVLEEYQQMGIKISNTYPIYREFRFSPSFKKIEIYSKDEPLFYNFLRGHVDKKSFDVELYKVAKKNGVKFYFNQNIDSAKVDIVASGTSFAKGVGYGEYYSQVSEIIPNSNYIFLNNYYSSHGYSFILPFNNEAVIILGSTKLESKSELKKRFYYLKKNNPIIKRIIKSAKFKNEIFGHVFYDLPKTAVENGRLYIGEAAGFLDAATMFGSHYAILSGYLAAMAIIKNKNYNVLWKEKFGKELKNQYLKRKKIQKFENKDYESIIDNLIKNYGNRISSDEYRELHKSP